MLGPGTENRAEIELRHLSGKCLARKCKDPRVLDRTVFPQLNSGLPAWNLLKSGTTEPHRRDLDGILNVWHFVTFPRWVGCMAKSRRCCVVQRPWSQSHSAEEQLPCRGSRGGNVLFKRDGLLSGAPVIWAASGGQARSEHSCL